jgi:hypothetical protein
MGFASIIKEISACSVTSTIWLDRESHPEYIHHDYGLCSFNYDVSGVDVYTFLFKDVRAGLVIEVSGGSSHAEDSFVKIDSGVPITRVCQSIHGFRVAMFKFSGVNWEQIIEQDSERFSYHILGSFTIQSDAIHRMMLLDEEEKNLEVHLGGRRVVRVHSLILRAESSVLKKILDDKRRSGGGGVVGSLRLDVSEEHERGFELLLVMLYSMKCKFKSIMDLVRLLKVVDFYQVTSVRDRLLHEGRLTSCKEMMTKVGLVYAIVTKSNLLNDIDISTESVNSAMDILVGKMSNRSRQEKSEMYTVLNSHLF